MILRALKGRFFKIHFVGSWTNLFLAKNSCRQAQVLRLPWSQNLRTSHRPGCYHLCKMRRHGAQKRGSSFTKRNTYLPSAKCEMRTRLSDKTRDISHGAHGPNFLTWEILSKSIQIRLNHLWILLLPLTGWFSQELPSRPVERSLLLAIQARTLSKNKKQAPSAHLF